LLFEKPGCSACSTSNALQGSWPEQTVTLTLSRKFADTDVGQVLGSRKGASSQHEDDLADFHQLETKRRLCLCMSAVEVD